MIVQCSKCQARYRVADEKVPARGAMMRCTRCSSVFKISRPDSQAALPSQPAPRPQPPQPPQSAPAPQGAPRAAAFPPQHRGARRAENQNRAMDRDAIDFEAALDRAMQEDAAARQNSPGSNAPAGPPPGLEPAPGAYPQHAYPSSNYPEQAYPQHAYPPQGSQYPGNPQPGAYPTAYPGGHPNFQQGSPSGAYPPAHPGAAIDSARAQPAPVPGSGQAARAIDPFEEAFGGAFNDQLEAPPAYPPPTPPPPAQYPYAGGAEHPFPAPTPAQSGLPGDFAPGDFAFGEQRSGGHSNYGQRPAAPQGSRPVYSDDFGTYSSAAAALKPPASSSPAAQRGGAAPVEGDEGRVGDDDFVRSSGSRDFGEDFGDHDYGADFGAADFRSSEARSGEFGSDELGSGDSRSEDFRAGDFRSADFLSVDSGAADSRSADFQSEHSRSAASDFDSSNFDNPDFDNPDFGSSGFERADSVGRDQQGEIDHRGREEAGTSPSELGPEEGMDDELDLADFDDFGASPSPALSPGPSDRRSSDQRSSTAAEVAPSHQVTDPSAQTQEPEFSDPFAGLDPAAGVMSSAPARNEEESSDIELRIERNAPPTPLYNPIEDPSPLPLGRQTLSKKAASPKAQKKTAAPAPVRRPMSQAQAARIVRRERARRQAALSMVNVLSAMVVLFVALLALASLRSPRALTFSDLGFPMVWIALGLDSGAEAPPLVAQNLRTGVYRNHLNEEFFWVRGVVENTSGVRRRAVQVQTEVVRGEQILGRATSLTGLDARPDQLAGLKEIDNNTLQLQLLGGGRAPALRARGKAPFIAIFPLSSSQLVSSRVRVEVNEGIPQELLRAGVQTSAELEGDLDGASRAEGSEVLKDSEDLEAETELSGAAHAEAGEDRPKGEGQQP